MSRVNGVKLLSRNFTTFAKEVNNNRAFPYALNGMKPVAAHGVWSMYENKRTSNRDFTVSVKVIGEVVNYHPHAEPYEQLARWAQDFVFHLPLIEGKGAFGSIKSGTDVGASRYTKMRLAPLTEDVLLYNERLLDMGLNYLEEDREPIPFKWVSLLPTLFTLGDSGIGYTESNNWSPSNLFEIRDQVKMYLKNGKTDPTKIFPDFPNECVLVNKSEVKDIYEKGKGKIVLRGKVTVDKNTINIHSLPFGVYPSDFISKASDVVNTLDLKDVKAIRDESSKDRYLICVECQDKKANEILEILYAKTPLQTTIVDNRLAVSEKGTLEIYTLQKYIELFVRENINLVLKEAKLNVEDIKARLEIVDGLLNALQIIDKIIKEIKSSKSVDEARKSLISKFKFTENQAKAIVSTTLGKLANLEQIKLKEEKEKLDKDLKHWETLINDEKERQKYFYNRFSKLVDKYGWERKTELLDVELNNNIKISKPKKETVVVLTKNNTIKKIPTEKYRKVEDDLQYIKTKESKFIYIDEEGQMYKPQLKDLSNSLPNALGDNITDKKILAIFSEEEKVESLLFITKNGLAKLSKGKILKTSKNVGTTVMGLKEKDDKVMFVLPTDKTTVITNQREVEISGLRESGRTASGAKFVKLRKNEEIIDIKE